MDLLLTIAYKENELIGTQVLFHLNYIVHKSALIGIKTKVVPQLLPQVLIIN
jgi:hypothetical protein